MPYTTFDRGKVLVASAILGWAWVTFLSIGRDFRYLILAAILGLPVAFLATFLIGMPVLDQVMRKSLTYARAAVAGGMIAAFMAVAKTAIFVFFGWRESLDPRSHSQIGGEKYIIAIDGILTPYGWLLELKSCILLTAAGAVIGVLMRAWIGPGRLPSH